MKRFQDYCEMRRQEEDQQVAYMVSGDAPAEEAAEAEDEDFMLMFLDSGCNSTCHGERWMKKYTEGTNYSPDWESRVERFFTGIGGSTRCIGVRKLYGRSPHPW